MIATKRYPRSGYTLMEIVVVLAIFLMVAAISIPVIQSMMDDARMTGAADLIRARAADARARAMDSGKPWRLAFIPNSRTFQLAPDDAPEWETTEGGVVEKEGLMRDELPEGIYFGVSAGAIQGSKEPGQPGDAWQTIAVYLYTGDAREDSIVYFGQMGVPPMAMELRGLTGSVTLKTAAEVMAMQP